MNGFKPLLVVLAGIVAILAGSSEASAQVSATAYVKIQSAGPDWKGGLFMGVKNMSPNDNALIDIEDGNAGYHSQQWTLIYVDARRVSFYIVNRRSGRVLDVPDSVKSQTLIQQFGANGGLNQQWTTHPHPNCGYFYIVNVNSGLVLDVRNADPAAGTLVQQYPKNGGWNQAWRFIKPTSE